MHDLLGDLGRVEDESNAVRGARLFILPFKFVRDTRYRRQQMYDVIPISNKGGHSDIFVTVTCNLSWAEIQRSLLPGQVRADRPDLCGRVSRIKLRVLMSFVVQEKLFGTVAAYVCEVEFQKRGRLHPHCIFFLDEAFRNKLRSPGIVDRVILAEIPPELDAHLQELVLRHMIYSPCGKVNTFAPYMGTSACKKGFSKLLGTETGHSSNHYYVVYRHRSPQDGGVSVKIELRAVRRARMVALDNSWVGPYSPALLHMFARHIKVELCVSRIGCIEYLFEYA